MEWNKSQFGKHQELHPSTVNASLMGATTIVLRMSIDWVPIMCTVRPSLSPVILEPLADFITCVPM